MKHTIDEMKAKIHEMYPKIDKHGVAATVTFDKSEENLRPGVEERPAPPVHLYRQGGCGQMHGRG